MRSVMTLSFWNATQAAVWIASRDQVATEASRSDTTIIAAENRVANSAVPNSEIPLPSVSEAISELVSKCATGDIIMIGRRHGTGSPEPLDAHNWAYLQIRDAPQRDGVVAVIPEPTPRPVRYFPTWWGDLRLSASDVQDAWPPLSRRKKNNSVGSVANSAPKPKIGRHEFWEWAEMTREINRIVDLGKLPKIQAHLERMMADWFVKNFSDQPSESEIRKKVGPIWRSLAAQRKPPRT
jgi:hypothetical protein